MLIDSPVKGINRELCFETYDKFKILHVSISNIKKGRYMHFKQGEYELIDVAIHSEAGEEYAVYRALYGSHELYVRPLDMFFSKVDKEKYPEVAQEYRFQYVGE